MEDIKRTKYAMCVVPEVKNNGAPASLTYVDTAGYKHLRMLFLFGDVAAATTAAPKLTECDTSGGEYSDISGAALDAVVDTGDDNKIFAIDVDLKDNKRYIKPSITVADNSTGEALCVLAILSNCCERAPESASEAGLEELTEV